MAHRVGVQEIDWNDLGKHLCMYPENKLHTCLGTRVPYAIAQEFVRHFVLFNSSDSDHGVQTA